MFDINSYQDKKVAGLVSLAKVGDAYAISYKQFDANTGVASDPVVIGISMDDVIKRQKDLQVQLDQVANFISDLQALN